MTKEETLVPVKPIYSYFDIKTREWSDPQVHETEEALFQFLSLVVNTHGSGAVHTHPEDFVVYEVGTFNPETGSFTVYEEKEMVATLSSLKKPCDVCEAETKKQMEMIENG